MRLSYVIYRQEEVWRSIYFHFKIFSKMISTEKWGMSVATFHITEFAGLVLYYQEYKKKNFKSISGSGAKKAKLIQSSDSEDKTAPVVLE